MPDIGKTPTADRAAAGRQNTRLQVNQPAPESPLAGKSSIDLNANRAQVILKLDGGSFGLTRLIEFYQGLGKMVMTEAPASSDSTAIELNTALGGLLYIHTDGVAGPKKYMKLDLSAGLVTLKNQVTGMVIHLDLNTGDISGGIPGGITYFIDGTNGKITLTDTANGHTITLALADCLGSDGDYHSVSIREVPFCENNVERRILGLFSEVFDP